MSSEKNRAENPELHRFNSEYDVLIGSVARNFLDMRRIARSTTTDRDRSRYFKASEEAAEKMISLLVSMPKHRTMH